MYKMEFFYAINVNIKLIYTEQPQPGRSSKIEKINLPRLKSRNCLLLATDNEFWVYFSNKLFNRILPCVFTGTNVA